jgi:hyperosmotically inducible periplasmic protein
MKVLAMLGGTAILLSSLACSNQNNVSYKNNVQKSLEQADLKDVSVSEDRDKNTITLSGTLHSEEAKAKAGEVARGAAISRIIANEISVQPVGAESEAKDTASALDDGIESNYKAALISSGLEKQDVNYSVNNGVLTLTGRVGTPTQRAQAQGLAAATPNVKQVINQIEVKR